ncbi:MULTISPECIES: alanine--glyoxylate aminotransferase family protein [unclassified Achromobacter]|uniref:pyridoxal-phosphate-dependent aminotransferase family protein n=1 Tax=unclassified Achromobacter TaxID=2626865 RepID=UPI00130342A7|nr:MULTISPECIES: alanine--glyoxylate aminotransferase family protein [unclassified Achromobacter]
MSSTQIQPLAPDGYRLRLPGPTFVPERVLQAGAQLVVNHRGPEFRAALVRAEAGLQPILGTRNRILFYAASGSGMMEAAIVNVAGPGDELLIVTHGQFGERFTTIAQAVGAKADVIATPWGEDIDIDAVQARLREKPYRAMVVVHNESSTGIVADLASLGALVRNSPTLLVVDSVSGLGGIEMKQDEWGVDILVSASQKALMCPPGLGLASISPKAWDVINGGGRLPSFYWDFRRAQASAEKGETPFTPAVGLVAGLLEALDMIHAEGLPQVLARHTRLANALRAGGAAIGLSDFGTGKRKSATVVVFDVPAPLDGAVIVRELYQRHRTVIAGARNRLSGKVIRIGTMGAIDADTIYTDLAHLENVLPDLGHALTAGAGVAAAKAYLE